MNVTPLSIIGRDFKPHNNFMFTCVAGKPLQVLPALHITWHHNGVQLSNSLSTSITELDADNEKTSVLLITSANVKSSGAYNCIASLSIPDSLSIQSNEAASVFIQGL